MLMIDLYSGLGGASEAFVEADWTVYRIEKESMFCPNHGEHPIPHTIIGDACALRPAWLRSLGPIDLLWASPPCRDFSNAYSAPGPVAAREGRDFKPDMTLIMKAVAIRDQYEPHFWCFENVVGAIPHFRPLLGEPTQIIGPFVLWHNLPTIAMDYAFEHTKGNAWPSPLRPWVKAKLPIELSRAVLDAALSPTLEAWE
jgi:site-specific DNA-cytosine methylase